MVQIHHEAPRVRPDTHTNEAGLRGGAVSEPLAPESRPDRPQRTTLVESILDNLSFWTIVALVIGLLYLVWATLEILGRYVGDLPKLVP
jgi:hypothetical protein